MKCLSFSSCLNLGGVEVDSQGVSPWKTRTNGEPRPVGAEVDRRGVSINPGAGDRPWLLTSTPPG